MSQVSSVERLSAAIMASKGAESEMPRVEEAIRTMKLNALYALRGDEREALSREFERIDREHHAPKGICRYEYHQMIEDAIYEATGFEMMIDNGRRRR